MCRQGRFAERTHCVFDLYLFTASVQCRSHIMSVDRVSPFIVLRFDAIDSIFIHKMLGSSLRFVNAVGQVCLSFAGPRDGARVLSLAGKDISYCVLICG